MNRTPLYVLMLVAASLLAIMSYNTNRPQAEPVVCGDRALQTELKQLMSDAIDAAFKQHLAGLYQVMLKDLDTSAARMRAGSRLGAAAYIQLQQHIDGWTLEPCK